MSSEEVSSADPSSESDYAPSDDDTHKPQKRARSPSQQHRAPTTAAAAVESSDDDAPLVQKVAKTANAAIDRVELAAADGDDGDDGNESFVEDDLSGDENPWAAADYASECEEGEEDEDEDDGKKRASGNAQVEVVFGTSIGVDNLSVAARLAGARRHPGFDALWGAMPALCAAVNVVFVGADATSWLGIDEHETLRVQRPNQVGYCFVPQCELSRLARDSSAAPYVALFYGSHGRFEDASKRDAPPSFATPPVLKMYGLRIHRADVAMATRTAELLCEAIAARAGYSVSWTSRNLNDPLIVSLPPAPLALSSAPPRSDGDGGSGE
jgi:hypothetical protein